jgi:endo-1,4-beta-xylanase
MGKLHVIMIVGALLGAVVLAVIGSLFFARSRKAGIRMLTVIGFMLAVGAPYYYLPRNFPRNYLADSQNIPSVAFRQFADRLNIHIGIAGKVGMFAESRFTDNFNSATPDDVLKMGSLLENGKVGEYDFAKGDEFVDTAIAHHVRIKGHELVWGTLSDTFKSPDLEEYLQRFPADKRSEVLWQVMRNHIKTVLTHYRSRIHTWDAVGHPLANFGNGTFDNNVYFRHLGEAYVAKTFEYAHTVDPTIKLYLNEQFNEYDDARALAFIDLVARLKKAGVPIHGVGIQGHNWMFYPDLVALKAFTDKLGALGVEYEFTEVDARLRMFKDAPDPYIAQGNFYASIVKACLGDHNCKGVTFWGLNDHGNWYDDSPMIFSKPNDPTLFDRAMHPKPGVAAIARVLREGVESGGFAARRSIAAE